MSDAEEVAAAPPPNKKRAVPKASTSATFEEVASDGDDVASLNGMWNERNLTKTKPAQKKTKVVLKKVRATPAKKQPIAAKIKNWMQRKTEEGESYNPSEGSKLFDTLKTVAIGGGFSLRLLLNNSNQKTYIDIRKFTTVYQTNVPRSVGACIEVIHLKKLMETVANVPQMLTEVGFDWDS